MATRKRSLKKKRPSLPARGKGGRFISATDAKWAKKELAQRKKDDTTRLEQLFKRKRRKVDDGKAISTEIAERKTRPKTRKRGGEFEYSRGNYELRGIQIRNRRNAREKIKDYIADNAKRGDRAWLNVKYRGKSIGTPASTPEKTYRYVDTFLTRYYVRDAFNIGFDEGDADIERYPIYWEVVIIRKAANSSKHRKRAKRRAS